MHLKEQEESGSKCLMCREIFLVFYKLYIAPFKPLETNILGKLIKASRAIVLLEKKERARLAK